jgi:adenylate cyclase class 2
LKARDPDPERSPATCTRLGARAEGLLLQRDTYFNVPRGRLKLREQEGSPPHLIAYERPDRADRRESRYRLIQVDSAPETVPGLSATLGVKVIVAKERRLFIWHDNVRIHIDDVEGLGRFIEFEAVAPADSDLTRERAQIETLQEAFHITESDLVAGSYSDLMVRREGEGITRLNLEQWRRGS